MAASMVSPYAFFFIGQQPSAAKPMLWLPRATRPDRPWIIVIFFTHGANGSSDRLIACPSSGRSSSFDGVLGNSIPAGCTSRGYTPLPCTKNSTRAGLALGAASS